MLGVFSAPVPDELIYGTIARYAALIGHHGDWAVQNDIFGRAGGRAPIDLPSGLGCLADRLPVGTGITARQIVDGHTALPYFIRFLPKAYGLDIRHRMESSTYRPLETLNGLMSHRFRFPSTIQICNLCAVEDMKQFGFLIWRRIHQPPGVSICATHEVLIRQTTVPRFDRKHRSAYVPLTGALLTASLPISAPNLSRPFQRAAATETRWLLNNSFLTGCSEDVAIRLDKLLSSAGWRSSEKLFRTAALATSIMRNRDCSEVFQRAGINDPQWILYKLIYDHTAPKHPLLLLVRRQRP